MYSQINGPFLASEVLSVSEVPVAPGQPSFANLKTGRSKEWHNSPDLHGPGIYGVFCKGSLYYVGIYTGRSGSLFTGSALDRWDMHLTYFSVRSPSVCFVPRSMKKILKLPGSPAEEYAALLGGRDLTIDQIARSGAPFIAQKSASCTFNKVVFASQNWDVFKPGNEEGMMSDVSFVYGRILPEAGDLLGNAVPGDRYWWAKYQWLQARETRLVNSLKPICNAVTDEYLIGITVDQFKSALQAELDTPLSSFDETFREASRSKTRAGKILAAARAAFVEPAGTHRPRSPSV